MPPLVDWHTAIVFAISSRHCIWPLSAQRHPVLPEVPTVAESGQPAFAYRFWVGIFGPPKLPGELVARLNAEIHQMVKAPETVERFRSLGYRSYAGSPEAMRADLAKASRDAADIVKRLNLQPTD